MNSPKPAHALALAEFDAEMASTRKLLARIPDDRADFKPHEKSFSLAHLAQLVSMMPGWIARTLRDPHIDLMTAQGYSNERTQDLVTSFDQHVADARAALESVTGDRLEESWSLMRGDMVLMTGKKGEMVRQHLNHLIHHRGQLTVYARMVEVPLPMIYGPTADERWDGPPK